MKKIRNLLLALLSVACVSAFAGCQFGVPTQNGGSSSSTSEKVSSSSVKENSSSEEEASSSKGSSSSGKESSSGVGGSSSSEDSSSSVEESSSSEDSSSNVGGSSSSEDSSSSVGGNPPITGAGCTEEEWNATMEALADVDNVTMTGGSISIDHNGEEGATKQVSTVLKLTEKGTYIYGVHMDGSSAGYVYEEYYIKEGSSYTEYFRSHHANEEWSKWRCYPDQAMGFSMADLTTIIPDDYSLYEYDAESGYMIATDVQHYSAALDSTLQFKTVAIQIVDGQLTSVAAEFAETVDLGFDICFLAFSYTDYGDTTFELPFYGDSEGLEFTLNVDEQSYTVTDVGTCETDYLMIPATYEDLPVTAIGNSAFYNCYNLTSIEIPDSVTTIGAGAFYNCSSLTSIEIPDSVTTIGDEAFHSCINLTSVEIPDSVTSIGPSTFRACAILTSVIIGDSVTTIGDDAFYHCDSLTSIVIPDSVTTIGNDAFEGCRSLKSIEIPDSVTTIGYEAFEDTGCYNEESNWENGVLYIGKHLIEAKTSISGVYTIKEGTLCIAGEGFEYCSSLTSIEIPDSVITICRYAFSYCRSLTSVEIPDSVTEIGGSTFRGCSSLTSVVLGNSVTRIGEWAFSSCSKLTSIEIPNSVTTIGDYAFYSCSSLTSITFEGTVEEWNAISKGSSWRYNVPATEVVCKDGSVAL